ncbi:MAG: phosphatidylserine decarboxylase family protein [Phycisphaerae bacterium]|nr:phosphatidylserine decarboxylase family protein [Phycisphaerae bacterium]
MKIPITKYGLPQAAVFPAIVAALMLGVWLLGGRRLTAWQITAVELVLLTVLIWVLAFFRDPERHITADANVLLSPADGVIADIQTVANPFGSGEAVQIGIFLNIFNVHINRVPCAVRIEEISYKEGRFINAMHADAGRVNESNDVTMTRLAAPHDRLRVRQISGAIARRIVCDAKPNQDFAAGERFGMIKFGSRTELLLPMRDEATCLVTVGDKVKAGLTVLVRYE